MGFSKIVSSQALTKSGRNCCLCRKFCGLNIQTHHIVPLAAGGDNSFDNCVPLCLECHASIEGYNPKHPIGRKMQPDELKWMRDQLYIQVAEGTFTPVADISGGDIIGNIMISGNNNVTASGDINFNPRIVHRVKVQYDAHLYIANDIAKRISDLVSDLYDIRVAAGGDPKSTKPRIWSTLNNRYKVTSYKLIPKESGDDAVIFLYKQINLAKSSIRRKDPELWKKTLYKSIYARLKDIGIEKDELYNYAHQAIPLKKSITSLKELTMKDLDRLNQLLINLQKRSV